jgi:hypothetical protein
MVVKESGIPNRHAFACTLSFYETVIGNITTDLRTYVSV